MKAIRLLDFIFENFYKHVKFEYKALIYMKMSLSHHYDLTETLELPDTDAIGILRDHVEFEIDKLSDMNESELYNTLLTLYVELSEEKAKREAGCLKFEKGKV